MDCRRRRAGLAPNGYRLAARCGFGASSRRRAHAPHRPAPRLRFAPGATARQSSRDRAGGCGGCPPPAMRRPASSSAPHFACGCMAASSQLLPICCGSRSLRPRKIGTTQAKQRATGSLMQYAGRSASRASMAAAAIPDLPISANSAGHSLRTRRDETKTARARRERARLVVIREW